jgi:hypothetical protein
MIKIGTLNESSLHGQIKKWYKKPGDKLEVKLGRYFIDIVQGETLVEIQTKSFYTIRNKLQNLVQQYPVRLVHPIAGKKLITRIDPKTKKVIATRKSPKKGKFLDIFDELIRIPDLINHDKFTVEVLITEEEEIRCPDGKGSWRRRGQSIIDHKLLKVCERKLFQSKDDFLRLLPKDLKKPFTNKSLAIKLKIPVYKARVVTYCLRKMDAIWVVGRDKEGMRFDFFRGNVS